ncbi:MAG TPA: SDR family NAD(P)-dependent oxidoreductase [Puia sp.]|jgi:NAD(P)-dependent dehydrogenase (short-subunit alcohol dehydrogenase family)|nr:SDR family NAD(P)-dependent oxidoreductase [Puia sp.]
MKTVIITGGNGNLGTAVTKEFLNKNYQVLATVSNENEKSNFQAHPNLDISVVNLTNEKETYEFVQKTIQKYGIIDGALLLVGGFVMGTLSETSGEDLHKQIALNFETAYYVTRPLFEHLMKNKGGSIVFIGARPALNPAQGKGLIAYGLSKSLLFKLAEFLNEEAKGVNVSISVVVPSTLDTALNRKSIPDANPENWVKPSELAETLEFLFSDKAKALRETVLKVYNNA